MYFRMLVTMAVGLYTSRVVLSTLGVSDYGLYNVVGGFVTFLSFISLTMTNATQRFVTFALGNNDIEKTRAVVANAMLLHIFISVVILVLAEIIGPWFVENKLTIPEGRDFAAHIVFQVSIITFIVSVLQTPFMSVIIAREKMNVYAYVSIYDAVAKLVAVTLLQLLDSDKLILYALLIAFVQVTDILMYILYCRKNFEESHFSIRCDKSLIKEMAFFSSWNLVGAIGCSVNGQGINVLLNMFFGTVVNAARGVAFQVNSILVSFSRNFQVASNPQIIKFYAEGNILEMENLMTRTAKLSAFLMVILMMPLMLDIEYVLRLWLVEYPEQTPIFLRIILIQSLIQTISGPVVTVTHATGKIKLPNLTSGLSLIIFLPITYIVLKLGATPTQVFLINVIPWFLECFFDSYFAAKYTGISQKLFYTEVYGRVFIVLIFSLIIVLLFQQVPSKSEFLSFVRTGFTSVAVTVFMIYLIGLNKKEREMIKKYVKNKKNMSK